MCGRFTLTVDLETLRALFRFRYQGSLAPRFNIAPSQEVLTVIVEEGERIGKMMRWGLVPFWAKDDRIGVKMITPGRKQSMRRRVFTMRSSGGAV